MSGAEAKLDRSVVEAREVDGELVIYDLARRRYLGGNRTAARLWPLLLEGADLDTLTGALESEYGIDSGTARRDAEAFVSSLRTHGLLMEPDG